MKQTSADAGVGHILTLEQITERSVTCEGRQGIADPVGQIRRNILILVVAHRVFRQQLVLQCCGKIIGKQRLFVRQRIRHQCIGTFRHLGSQIG